MKRLLIEIGLGTIGIGSFLLFYVKRLKSKLRLNILRSISNISGNVENK